MTEFLEFMSPKLRKHNPYRIEGGRVFIELEDRAKRKVGEAVIDESDLPQARMYRWYKRPNGYVMSSSHKFLHRVITGLNSPGTSLVVDHVDGDPLNNCRSNLRVVTQSENNFNNHQPHKHGRFGITGITWNKRAKKWQVQVGRKNGVYYGGLFTDIVEAIETRDIAREVPW